MTDQSGRLVVKANPEILIRGTVDWMPTSVPIIGATLADGVIAFEYGDAYKDFPDGTMIQTRGGLTLYEDFEAREYTEDQVAILTEAGALVDLPCEPGPRFNDTSAADGLLRELLAYEAEAWDGDLSINGGDLVEFLGDWRTRAKAALGA